MSYLVLGGLSPISVRGLVPALLSRTETKKVVLYDDLSGGNSSSSALADPRVSLVLGSTFNETLLTRVLQENEITHVIDLASLSTPRTASPVELARTSVVGFTHVLDAVRHYGKQPRFVLVSREQTAPDSTALPEDVSPAPTSLIQAAAMSAEALLHSYVISYRMPLVVARLTDGVIGHDLNRGAIGFLFQKGAHGKAIYSALSIRDSARGILAVLEKGRAPEIYNIHGRNKDTLQIMKCGDEVIAVESPQDPTQRGKANAELGFEPLDKDIRLVINEERRLLGESSTACGPSHAKLLVYGAEGRVGKKFVALLRTKGVAHAVAACRPGADADDTVREEIDRVAPSHVVCLLGSEHTKTLDEKPRPARLLENVRDNLYAAWVLASICERTRCHFTYLGTGEIFKGEQGKKYTEDDLGNNNSSSYAVVKNYTERLLRQFSATLQVRIHLPLDTDAEGAKNLGELSVDSNPSSVSFLPECLPILLDLAIKRSTGVLNLANPGSITFQAVRSLVKSSSPSEDVHTNIVLDTAKLETLYKDGLTPVAEAVKKLVN